MSASVLPTTLEKALVEGTLIPFVGAGVSMAVKRKDDSRAFPSWPELLLRAADRLQQEGRTHHEVVRAMLKLPVPNYMESARYAREGLDTLWADFLAEAFGVLKKDVDDQSVELARTLWKLGSPLVITTNYDKVLRWGCPEADDLDEWAIEAPAGQRAALSGTLERATVWHLHGSLADPTRIILSPDGYAQLYTEASQASLYAAALETLRGLMATRHLLFVGFSLDDPFLVRQLEWVRDTFKGCGGPHYVLARARDIDGMRTKVANLGVEFVAFEDFGASMLTKLEELVAVRQRAVGGGAAHVEPRDGVAISPPSPPAPRSRIEGLRSDALQIFGRDRELAFLDRTWAESGPGKTNIVAFVAAGGVGKTSLVTEWINRLRDKGWRGAELVFTHSFYSQGVRDQGAASADAFVNEALQFFGDAELAGSNAAPERKGARLAELVARQRALLVLDGLEPLQQPPREGVHAGELKDPALRSLLGGLAHHNQGLCVLTTREAVYDLRSKGRAVREWDLEQLSEEASGALLEFLLTSERFKGPAIATTAGERAEIWEVVKGHAFTLQLLGRYLRRRRWDVRRWRDIRFEAADASVAGGHAFRMLDAYERWLGGKDAGGDEAPDGTRQLAVLRLLGFFDRPADPACIGALCQAPAIEGLTEPLVELDEEGWDAVLADLEDLGLVTRESWEPARVKGFREEQADLDTGEAEGEPEETPMPGWPRLTVELDAHPLVRQHFGRRVQETSETAWKEGHRRVFEHLCASTPYWPEGVEGLGPLFQAVAHGCQAEEVQRACDEVYYGRILRGTSGGGFYSTKKLGAFGAELGAVAWFFESRWSQPSPRLTNGDQAWLLNEAAFCLRALGRLAEAVEPMRAGLERRVKQENWRSAAIIAGNLSQLELTRGEVTEASRVAEQSVTFADRSTDAFQRMGKRTTHADALHHAGRRDEARRRFEEAEAIQAERQPGYPRLYSLQGFQCCDLLLFEAEHAAWRVTMARGAGSSSVALLGDARSSTSADAAERDRALAACADVLERAAQTLEWVTPRNLLLTIALDQLTLSRATLYRALLAAPPPDSISDPARGSTSPADLAAANQHINTAVDGLRRSGHLDHLPHGLLSRAWLRHLQSNPTAAATDLDEVEELATRCGMPIFLADAHLTRARLFRDHAALADARTLLADLRTRGYHRHDEMLADTELFAADWPPATP